MNLVISESEYGRMATDILETANSLSLIASDYAACLQSVKRLGYKSAASGAAIDERCSRVASATEQLSTAIESLQSKTDAHLLQIQLIDRVLG